MPDLIDRLTPYTMFGVTLLPAAPLLVLGIFALIKRRKVGYFLIAASGILIAIFPLTWIYLLVILICTGRNGSWIC